MLNNILWVACGGALGSVCRYLLSGMNTASIPSGTFLVNICGSLAIGLLVGWVNRGILSPEMKMLLITGFCGGFTTFSTFANESFGMMKAGEVLIAALYVASSTSLGILAVWLGIILSGSTDS
ncbi:MAG: fluoride efflux transporter CrcB [Prevotella sp.]